MAKIKIHELAKELDRPSKEILGFLQDKGIDAKVAQSTIEDDMAELVRKKFGASGSVPAAKSASGDKAASDTKSASDKKPVSEANEGTEEKRNHQEIRTEEAPKKKKKIIFVSNPQNSNISGQRSGRSNRNEGSHTYHSGPGNNGNRSPSNSGRNQGGRMQEAPHKIIRPLTAPSLPEMTQPDRKPKLNKPSVKKVPSVQETLVTEAPKAENQVSVPETAVPRTSVPGTEAVPRKPVDSSRVERPQGERPHGERPQGDGRPAPSYRKDGQPPRRYPQGSGSDQNRSQDARGNRGERTFQQRSGSPQGDRPARPGDGRRSESGSRPDYARRPESNNRPGGGYQNDRRPGGYHQGGGRPAGSDGRFEKGNDRPDNRFGRTAGGKGPVPENTGKDSKHREEEKRRINQEKDKRSRKDFAYEEKSKVNTKRKVGAFIKPEKKAADIQEEQIKVIVLPEVLIIKELADKMKIQPSVIIKKLFLQGQIVNVNSELSYEEAENIAIEYDIICEREVKVDIIEELLKEEEENEGELVKRAPIICVMGHVDHGKTSLLDAIRKTHVTEKESGGITQHIGAYTVTIHDQKITFLDTPGHEAFTAMRMRGANATDIAILVVAADDGVMPQTVEAISHAKAAGIEIIVAVNKIDKPSANMDRVKQEMTEYELIPADWGGTTEYVPVSAKTGEGLESLLETILLTAEIMELRANPNRQARGLVIEAELDKGRGPVATVLVQKGTLHVGDFISAGSSHGKVRAMVDDKGRRVKEAIPSTPVEILGLSDVPSAGEIFIAHENDKTAKNYAETYQAQNKVRMLEDTKSKMSLDDLFNKIQAGNLKELNIIVKADVQGSVEAVKQSLLKLSNEEVVVKCIHGGVGAINESDVSLASTSSAIIIGFNVRPDATAKASAEQEGVDIRLYKVIYQAIEDIEAAMKGMLDPVFEEKILGHAEIRQIFKASAIGNIAGSYVLDGVFTRNCKVRISREGSQIFEGALASLKRFKDDVKEVKAGYECGLVFEGFDQVQELDIVEAYTMVEVPR